MKAKAEAKAKEAVLRGASSCDLDPRTGHCVTCADEGLEGRILAVLEDGLADVELEGGAREVAVELIDEPAVGDLVLVHAGVAIARVAHSGES